MSRRDADRRVAALAGRRHGIASWEELAAAGLGRKAVATRVADGRFVRIHRGVYLIARPAPPLAHEAAALVACGAAAVLSHSSAAAMWGFAGPVAGPLDVTVRAGQRRSRPGLRLHEAQLNPRDVRRRHDLPVTSPARTLLDLATTTPASDLAHALNEAQVQRLTTPIELRSLLARSSGHQGAGALRGALDTAPGMTRSEAERRLFALVAAAELPRPVPNARVAGWEVDLHWPGHDLVVEFDSWQFHSTRAAFERDRRKDAGLQLAGQRVVRVTDRQVPAPVALAARLATLLATAPLPAVAALAAPAR